MNEISFQQGVRKANESLGRFKNLPLRLRMRIAQSRARRQLCLVLSDLHEPSPDFDRAFHKGMFLSYSYYAHFGEKLDDRADCSSSIHKC